MSINSTTNSQYVATKQSYDTEIDKAQQVQELQSQYMTLVNNGGSAADQQLLMKKIDALDPDHKIRSAFGSDSKTAIANLQQQEQEALGQLSAVMIGTDAIAQAKQAAQQVTGLDKDGPGMEPDINMRVMMTFAMLGDADNKVTESFMDQISSNVDKITQMTTLQQTVRDARPDGTDANKNGTLSADVVKTLQGLGVQVPTGSMTLSTDGKTYSMPQSAFDTLNNNVQSQSSTLTTLNQSTTIKMNKTIDVGNQCTQMQMSDLETEKQVLQKLVNG